MEIVSATADGDLVVQGDLDLSGYRYASLNPNTPLTEVYGSGEVGALVCLAAMAVALLLMLAPRQAATEPSLGGHIPH